MPPAPERRCGSQWRLLSKCSSPSTSRMRQLILYEFCKQSECVYAVISPPGPFIFILCALPDCFFSNACPTGCAAGWRGMGFAVRGVHSPPFSRRGGCAINKKIPFLSGADGVVSNFKQNKVRYADTYKEATRPF